MMSSSVAGNRSASHNGYSGEAYASLKYGLTINPLGRIDSQDPPLWRSRAVRLSSKTTPGPPRSLSPAAGG